MNRKWNVYLVLLSFLVAAQFFIMHTLKEEEEYTEENEVSAVYEEDKGKNIKEVYDDLEKIPNSYIEFSEKKGNKWSSTLIITGNYNEIINAVNAINNFRIKDYNILYEDNKFTLNIKVTNL